MALAISTSPDAVISSENAYWYSVNNPLIWTVTGATTGHFLKVKVYNSADAIIYTGIYTALSGVFTVRLDTVLKELVFLENVAVLGSAINAKEARISSRFGLYYESGTMAQLNANEHTADITKFYRHVLHSARQIGCLYGANMAEYILFWDGTPYTKFLTMFDTPKYWEGYPFQIDFLWDAYTGEIVGGFPRLSRAEIQVALNGTDGAVAHTPLVTTGNEGFLNHLKLAGSYVSKKSIKLYLEKENAPA